MTSERRQLPAPAPAAWCRWWP
uniref:Uncharacterized protein n=1 Tax=Arundo donax TaxID=35708 RepID=A0A0A9AQE7_ARUDO